MATEYDFFKKKKMSSQICTVDVTRCNSPNKCINFIPNKNFLYVNSQKNSGRGDRNGKIMVLRENKETKYLYTKSEKCLF